MTSWLKGSKKNHLPPPETLTINHNSGFFSCCSVRLEKIIEYFNKYKQLPYFVDSSEQFGWYRPNTVDTYFTMQSNEIKIRLPVNYENWHQYTDYKKIDYKLISPFIIKYFSPSIEIQEIIRKMESKYSLNYENLCVLFYRGNDKLRETELCPYSQYIVKATQLKQQNPKIQFLIQSDETECIETFLKEFPGSFYFQDEIRHIKKSDKTVDTVFKETNHLFSKYYLAITYIMAKSKYIICGSGNCSIWIAFFRGNPDGILQYLHNKWI